MRNKTNMDLVKKNCCLYLRVSSEEQIKNFSLENQEKLCTEKAQKEGYTIVKTYRDEGESAKTTNRPQFLEMLSYIKNNKVDAVIVYHSSRFSRNVMDFLLVKQDFSKYGTTLISCTEENLGLNTPEANLISIVLSAINQYDNENKARASKNGLRKRWEQGYFMTKSPLGFKSVVIDGRADSAPDETWYPILQKMFYRIYKERLTLFQATKELNKYSLKQFDFRSVKDMFINTAYIGYPHSRKYGTSPTRRIEPMVPEHVFCEVRNILLGKKYSSYARLRDDFALRKILKCPTCSSNMTSAWSKGQYKKYPYYICHGIDHRVNLNRDNVEDSFLELLKTIRWSQKRINYFCILLKEKYDSKYRDLYFSRHVVKKDIEDLNKTLTTLKLKHLKGIYDDDEFVEIKEELENEIMTKKTFLPDKKMDIRDIDTTLEFMKFYLTNLDKLFLRASPEGRMAIGSSIFPKGVTFENEKCRTDVIGREYDLIRHYATSKGDYVPRVRVELT
ncbi:recombinase family protein [Candidatus Gottesmanbacteria bacterium]|nr:recombinase family protein [Candidatus Gottesmanbacteria bacterium]